MSARSQDCDPQVLERYWLGELDASSGESVEEHLFACAPCARWLEELAALQEGLGDLMRAGAVLAATTDAVVARALEQGLRLRTYRIPAGGTVHCTIAPEDDANVVRLSGPFSQSERIDLQTVRRESDEVVSSSWTEDVPVDRGKGEIILLSPGEAIRALPVSSFELEVVGREASGRMTPLGRYRLEHSPWSS